MPTLPPLPHTVEALLRVVAERDSEVAFLKLMVDKLTLQVLRARRAQYGRSSEQLDDLQIALIEGEPLYELPARKAPPKTEAANGGIDRQLRHTCHATTRCTAPKRPTPVMMRRATPAAARPVAADCV